jgi:rubredoxin
MEIKCPICGWKSKPSEPDPKGMVLVHALGVHEEYPARLICVMLGEDVEEDKTSVEVADDMPANLDDEE